ncbi:MAG: siderophore-interacting protein [Pseudomonadota bacterium]
MTEHAAHLTSSPEPVFEKLSEIAVKNGFTVTRAPGVMRIDAPLGRVEMLEDNGGTKVAFAANTAPELQLLKDLYAGRFETFGFDTGIRWTSPKQSTPLNQVLCQVVRSTTISPNFQRVRLAGDFSAFAEPGVGLHFRLLFGPDGAGWPYLDDNGLTTWPHGVKSWHRPPYTVRRLASDASWMDLDIVLHSGGLVTEWSLAVESGAEIAIHGPSGSKQPTASQIALFGDETALPVILRIIEDAPVGTTGHACILLRDLRDVQKVETASDIAVTWTADFSLSEMLAHLEKADLPPENRHVFFAGERADAARMREAFIAKGLARGEFKSASYWTRYS